MVQFQVHKNDITQTRLVASGDQPDAFDLVHSDILVKVESFSFTANNVTYFSIAAQIGY